MSTKFYGEPDTDPDLALTKLDGKFAACVAKWRDEDVAAQQIRPMAEQLCTNLAFRGRNLREVFYFVVDVLLESMQSRLKDPDKAKRWIWQFIERRPEEFTNMFKDELRQKLPPDCTEEQLNTAVEASLRMLPQYMETNSESISDLSTALFSVMRSNLREMVNGGHMGALLKGVIPEPRIELLDGLCWRLVDCPAPANLLLGDCGPVAETAKGHKALGWVGKDERIQRITLPIASTTLLLGYKDSGNGEVDADQINEWSARCSHEFCVASEDRRAHRELTKSIGTDSVPMSTEEIERIAIEAI